MTGVWASVLPYALAAAVIVAVVRPHYLREAYPGRRILQRVGLFILAAPLFFLLFIGLAAVPGVFVSRMPAAVDPDVLATKALLHFGLYLALPAIGLTLVFGPRDALVASIKRLFGGVPTRERLSGGLAQAAALSLGLTALIFVGWEVLPQGKQGLFAAEGARVFFSNTTPGVALLLAGAAAIAEETLFRGVLLEHLRRTMNVHVGVGLQAIAFGLIHAGYGSALHVVAAGVFGLMMGYLALRHGLLPAMIVHFLVNVVILSAWSSAGAALWPLIIVSLLALAGAWVHNVLSTRPGRQPEPVAVV